MVVNSRPHKLRLFDQFASVMCYWFLPPSKMTRFFGLLLCVSAIMVSVEARFLPYRWNVKQELDPNKITVITINGKTPAPIIKAQKGDTIVVHVTNNLEQQLALRWEGIQQIESRPCDETNGFILAGESCAYRLFADKVGNFSYQSESKIQRDIGLKGSIVVLSPDNEHP